MITCYYRLVVVKMRKTICCNRGVTLIEILTTVVIIGIISAMAVPGFQEAYARIRFRSANKDVVSTIRLARSLAVSNKENFGVYFGGDDRTVTLFKKGAGSGSPTAYEPGTDSIVRVDTLPPEFSYLGTTITGDAVVFRPNGRTNFVVVDGASNGRIVTEADNEDIVAIFSINILPSTGRVKITQADFY